MSFFQNSKWKFYRVWSEASWFCHLNIQKLYQLNSFVSSLVYLLYPAKTIDAFLPFQVFPCKHFLKISTWGSCYVLKCNISLNEVINSISSQKSIWDMEPDNMYLRTTSVVTNLDKLPNGLCLGFIISKAVINVNLFH